MEIDISTTNWLIKCVNQLVNTQARAHALHTMAVIQILQIGFLFWTVNPETRRSVNFIRNDTNGFPFFLLVPFLFLERCVVNLNLLSSDQNVISISFVLYSIDMTIECVCAT